MSATISYLAIIFAIIFAQSISRDHLSDAQGLKGGLDTKVGSGYSKFRESIDAFKQQQLAQQPIFAAISQVSDIKAVVDSSAQTFTHQQQQVVEERQRQQTLTNDAGQAMYGSVEGVPGVDFPGLTRIPNLKFSCENVPFNPGMYADESTGCQVYHLCYDGRRESFLCGVGTIFNQAILNCDFWSSVECSKSSSYYNVNANFGKSIAEGGGVSKTNLNRRVSSSLTRWIQPLATKTSDVSSQTFVSDQESLVVPQPNFINQINSGSMSSSFGGKTSERSFELMSGFVSPSRQVSLNRQSVGDLQRQFTYESSMAVRMPSEQNVTTTSSQEYRAPDANSRFVGKKALSKIVTNTAKGQDVEPPTLAQPSENFNEVPKSPTSSNEWKPFFKSKSSSKIITSTTPSPATSIAREPSTPPTVAQPDQEPTFSDSKSSGESNDESTSTTPEPLREMTPIPKSSPPPLVESSIESDVSTSISVTTPADGSPSPTPEMVENPPSATESTTTTAAPTTLSDAPQSSTTQAAGSSESSETAPATASATGANSSGLASGEMDTITSSVEYSNETTTSAPSERKRSIAAKKASSRTRRKKKVAT